MDTEHISGQDWLEVMEGNLPRDAAARIQGHFDSCPDCAIQFRELKSWTAFIAQETDQLRNAVTLSPADSDRLLDRLLGNFTPAQRQQPLLQSLVMVRVLLEPFCGSGMARASVELALRRSTSPSDPDLSHENWPVFVANLGDTLGSVCGLAAARLAKRAAGQLVETPA